MAKILIIDDSAIIRKLLADFLTDSGHKVHCSATAHEGITEATTKQFDLCICDLHLPKTTGYDVLTAVLKKKPLMRFLFTDSMPDQIAEQINGVGDYNCIRKPFELDQLRSILDNILKPVKSH
ncbi:MAG: response regulator [candidate division Zixibacteria bacterium]|nr:response regulator [candidate division Zixibacteria bacterium]